MGMEIESTLDVKAGKPVKYVPVTENYAQMQARINEKMITALTKNNETKYYDKNNHKVGNYRRIGFGDKAIIELNDGKKTCVATHMDKQYEWNAQNFVPIVFERCYEDKQK